MKTVFVIGNGFDLAHGLETSYTHFMSSLKDTKLNNKLINFFEINGSDIWSDIESIYFKILNSSCDKETIVNDIKFDNLYASSEKLDDDFEQIKELLQNYLLNATTKTKLKLIDCYSQLFSTFNDENTLILDFNYTNTIFQYINGIGSSAEHIKIHGKLMDDYNPIIFGYAANDEEASILSKKNDDYLIRNIKKLCYSVTDSDLRLKKMLDESDCSIDVYILGHSCGLSDKLILNELFTHKKVKSITIFHFGEMKGFSKTFRNINHIIDDYSKTKNEEKSFYKLNNYKQSTAIIQHNSTNTNYDEFLKFLNLMKVVHDNKQSSNQIDS